MHMSIITKKDIRVYMFIIAYMPTMKIVSRVIHRWIYVWRLYPVHFVQLDKSDIILEEEGRLIPYPFIHEI